MRRNIVGALSDSARAVVNRIAIGIAAAARIVETVRDIAELLELLERLRLQWELGDRL